MIPINVIPGKLQIFKKKIRNDPFVRVYKELAADTGTIINCGIPFLCDYTMEEKIKLVHFIPVN